MVDAAVVVVVGSRTVVVLVEVVVVMSVVVVAVSSTDPQATSTTDRVVNLTHDECRLSWSPCSRKAQRTVLRGGSGDSVALEVWSSLLGEGRQCLHEIVGEQVSGIPLRHEVEGIGHRPAVVGGENRLDPLQHEW